MLLWASTNARRCSAEAQQAIVDRRAHSGDGGWSTASRIVRGTTAPLDTRTDGYATGLVTLCAVRGDAPCAPMRRGLAWLPGSGRRPVARGVTGNARSASGAGKFMRRCGDGVISRWR